VEPTTPCSMMIAKVGVRSIAPSAAAVPAGGGGAASAPLRMTRPTEWPAAAHEEDAPPRPPAAPVALGRRGAPAPAAGMAPPASAASPATRK